MTRIASWAAALMLGLSSAGVRGDEPVVRQFQTAVAAKGADYVAARIALVARAAEARPVLMAAAGSSNWRERVTAAAVLGWIDHTELYAALASWRPPASATRLRNPMPASEAAARERLVAAGDPAIPFMLELLWKLDDDMWGGASERLAELQVADALPVFGERLTATDSYNGLGKISRFGAAATPYLLAALEKALGQRREIILQALGDTGDPGAEPALRRELLAGASADLRVAAAGSLGRLGAFSTLREELGDLAGDDLHREALLALGRDASAGGRAFLLSVASTSRRASDRTAAAESLLDAATPAERAAVCALLDREPSSEVRADLVELLDRFDRDDSRVLDALLGALADRALCVREAAAYGLRYRHTPKVTETLLTMLTSSDADKARLALIAAENTCGRAFGEAAVPWIANARTRELALAQLQSNPTPNATEPVRRLLADGDERIRFLAALTLGYSDDLRARAALEAAVKREGSPDVLRIIRESLAEWPQRSLCSTLEKTGSR